MSCRREESALGVQVESLLRVTSWVSSRVAVPRPAPAQGVSLDPRGGAGGALVLTQGPQSAGAVPAVVGGPLFKGSCIPE